MIRAHLHRAGERHDRKRLGVARLDEVQRVDDPFLVAAVRRRADLREAVQLANDVACQAQRELLQSPGLDEPGFRLDGGSKRDNGLRE
jgi:hypothetical protein